MTHRLGNVRALDGVRACAIAAVMGLHAYDKLFSGGAIGVDIFFALSAFLITSLILEETGEWRGEFRFAAFYWRRAFRLAPALLLWLVFLAAPTSIAINEGRRILPSTLVSLLYVGDFAVAGTHWVGDAYTHVWSLAIEEQFYLLWPVFLVSVLFRRSIRVRRAILIAGLGTSVFMTLIAQIWVPNAYFLPVGHLTPIAAGCLAADLFTFGIPLRVRQVISIRWYGWLVLGAGGVYIVGLSRLHLGRWTWLPPLLAIGFAGLLLHLLGAKDGRLARTLSLPPVVWIGKRSYGLYLYHRTLAILAPALIPGIKLKVAGPLTLAVAFTLAALSFSFVEQPLLRYGRYRFGRTGYDNDRRGVTSLDASSAKGLQ